MCKCLFIFINYYYYFRLNPFLEKDWAEFNYNQLGEQKGIY